MCNGCWTKVRLCYPPYVPPTPVAPEPISIATPDDSPRNTADAASFPDPATVVGDDAAGSTVVDQDPLGASASIDKSTKTTKVKMVYISADQPSAACIVRSPEGDDDDLSQVPKLKEEKCPGTS